MPVMVEPSTGWASLVAPGMEVFCDVESFLLLLPAFVSDFPDCRRVFLPKVKYYQVVYNFFKSVLKAANGSLLNTSL